MQAKSKTQTLTMTALMAAVLAVLSPISIPVGVIPVTLGVFAVYLTAALLPVGAACASLSVYLILGGIGLPIFSNYRGGPQMLVGPTGGYLFGYFIIVLLVSQGVKRSSSYLTQVAWGLAGLCGFYFVGTLWYVMVTKAGFLSGLAICVAPFVVPDVMKMAAALVLARLLRSRMRKGAGR